jgi:hypothetical protein
MALQEKRSGVKSTTAHRWSQSPSECSTLFGGWIFLETVSNGVLFREIKDNLRVAFDK